MLSYASSALGYFRHYIIINWCSSSALVKLETPYHVRMKEIIEKCTKVYLLRFPIMLHHLHCALQVFAGRNGIANQDLASVSTLMAGWIEG